MRVGTIPGRAHVRGRLRPQARDVLAESMIRGERIRGGVLLPDDSFIREWNIRHRWMKVWRVGDEVEWLRPGEWILVRHGRWSLIFHVEDDEGVHDVVKVDPDGIMIVSPEPLTMERPSAA